MFPPNSMIPLFQGGKRNVVIVLKDQNSKAVKVAKVPIAMDAGKTYMRTAFTNSDGHASFPNTGDPPVTAKLKKLLKGKRVLSFGPGADQLLKTKGYSVTSPTYTKTFAPGRPTGKLNVTMSVKKLPTPPGPGVAPPTTPQAPPQAPSQKGVMSFQLLDPTGTKAVPGVPITIGNKGMIYTGPTGATSISNLDPGTRYNVSLGRAGGFDPPAPFSAYPRNAAYSLRMKSPPKKTGKAPPAAPTAPVSTSIEAFDVDTSTLIPRVQITVQGAATPVMYTGPQGQPAIFMIPKGPYDAHFAHPDYKPASLLGNTAGATTSRALTKRKAPIGIGDISGALEFSVFDMDTKKALPGVDITSSAGSARTGSTGKATIKGVKPGAPYIVTFTKKGYFLIKGTYTAAPKPIDIGMKTTAEPPVKPSVKFAVLDLQVMGKDSNKPIPGVAVQSIGFPAVATDSSGQASVKYTSVGLPITLTKAGYQTRQIKPSQFESPSKRNVVKISPVPQAATAIGVVKDKITGLPIASAGGMVVVGDKIVGAVDASGRFILTYIPGTHTAEFRVPGYKWSSHKISFSAQPVEHTIELSKRGAPAAGPSAELAKPKITTPGSLRGQVIDESGIPLPAVRISEKGALLGLTQSDGSYYIPRIPAGDHIITFEKERYSPINKGVHIRPDEKTDQTVSGGGPSPPPDGFGTDLSSVLSGGQTPMFKTTIGKPTRVSAATRATPLAKSKIQRGGRRHAQVREQRTFNLLNVTMKSKEGIPEEPFEPYEPYVPEEPWGYDPYQPYQPPPEEERAPTVIEGPDYGAPSYGAPVYQAPTYPTQPTEPDRDRGLDPVEFLLAPFYALKRVVDEGLPPIPKPPQQ